MPDTPTVLGVGDPPLSPAAAFDLHEVRSTEPIPDVGGGAPDCVVCGHSAGVDAVAAVRQRFPDVPILYCDEEPDGMVAAEVTRLGATEYVVPGALEGETLTDRVREAVAGRRASAEAAERRRRDRRALRRFHEAVSDTDGTFEAKLDRLLAVGCEYLDLDIGFLTDVGESDLSVTHARDPTGAIAAGDVFPMDETYCKRTTEGEGLLGIRDATAVGWADDPAYEASGLRCYLGGKVVVDGELRGTLCFADTEPRADSFRESERTFVELLVEWLASELARRRREREVRAARDRADQTLERIDDAFFALDDEWQIVYMNDEAKRALAGTFADWVDEENVVGSNAWEAAPAAVDTPFFDAFHRALETQESLEFEEYYEPLDLWFAVRVYPSETGLSIYFSDVTERKRREEALSGLLEASRSLMSARSVEEIADVVGRAAADILGYPANAVRLYDAESGLLSPVAVSERTRELMGEREAYPPGEAFTGRAFAAGEPRYTPDGSELGRGPAFEDVGSLYAHPIGDHGVLTIGTAETDTIDETDRTLASLLAATAEAAFDAAAREASLRRYRAVYEHASEMILVIDPTGTVTLATAPLAERLGETPETLEGGPLGRLFHPEGAERGLTAAQALRESDDRTHVFETRLRGGDGVVPVEVEISLLPSDGTTPESCVLVVRDITELARTRTELADERVRFEQLFERSPDAIVDVAYEDSTPVVRTVNEAFEETFGYDADRVVGTDLNALVAPEDDESVELLDERASAGDHVAREVRRRTADGDRDFIFRGVPYDDDGSVPRAFGIYTDVTEQKRRERRLLVFDRMLRHNLRNEATTILGFTGELQRTLDGEPAHWAARANTAARKLAESSEHVRWVQRALDSDVPGTPAELASLVADVLATAREEYPEATLRADVPEAHEVSDGRLLKVALQELVENAVEHSDRESPTVEVSAAPGPGSHRDTLAVRVRDDGPGIPERERAVLTDEREITQLDHSRGLGLWLARWATQELGGRFWFEEHDPGATVVLEVPVATEDALGGAERGEAEN